MKSFLLAAVLALYPGIVALAADATPTAPPLHDGMIKVAFVLSKHANVMDIAGPWEVFQDTTLKGADGKDVSPYTLYTVASDKSPIRTAGANHPGLEITPDYGFADAPMPDIVVIGAQHGGPGLDEWLKKVHAEHKVIMSVCTGAFLLADTGLLDGKSATTHHWYLGNFAHDHPKVKLVHDVRYVEASPLLFSAGGLTSGVDLALHMVDQRFGRPVAEQTANYMEYLGTGWKSNKGIAALDVPVKREDWIGELASHESVVLHILTYGASPALSIDIPSQHVAGAPVAFKQDGKKLTLSFVTSSGPATLQGETNDKGTALTGTLTQDDREQALTLTKAAGAAQKN